MESILYNDTVDLFFPSEAIEFFGILLYSFAPGSESMAELMQIEALSDGTLKIRQETQKAGELALSDDLRTRLFSLDPVETKP